MTTIGDHQQKTTIECKQDALFAWRRKGSAVILLASCLVAGVLVLLLSLQRSSPAHNRLDSSSCQGSLSDLASCGGVRRRRRHRRVQEAQELSANKKVSASSSSSSTSSSSSYLLLPHGCLYNTMANWTRTRVCNSQDSLETIQSGACRLVTSSSSETQATQTQGQQEIRIFVQPESESSLISAWLLQIILSEMLLIPTSIETGISSLSSSQYNFYNTKNSNDDNENNNDAWNVINNHITTPSNAIQEALENVLLFHQDCTLASGSEGSGDTSSNSSSTTTGEDDDYQPCAHYIPESWHVSAEIMYNTELVEILPQPLGLLIQEGWYIPKFTIHRDTTLTNYIGMQNVAPSHTSTNQSYNFIIDNRRRHMADTFYQPTLWYDYCTYISVTACSVPDKHAQRAPRTLQENEAYYFAEATGGVLYTGHFQKSGLNDCDNHPTACVGHFGDYPSCDGTLWTSYAQAQIHDLNIYLDITGGNNNHGNDDSQQQAKNSQRGYSIQQLQQLWHAANATQSNIVIMWYDTSFLYHEYQKTPAKFMKVTLPPTSSECLDNRLPNDQQCSNDLETRNFGSPLGVCDYPIQPLYKLISTGFLHKNQQQQQETTTTITATTTTTTTSNSAAAYAVLRDFTLSNSQLSEIYDYWMQAKNGGASSSSSAAASASSPRQALCQWAVDNMDHLESFIPPLYPRTLVDMPHYSNGVMVAAVSLASLAMLLVLLVTVNVLRLRQRDVMQAGPVSLLCIMLFGAMLLGVGALLAAMPTTDGTCMAEIWFVNWGLGVLGLVPIMVKLRAIRQGACITTKSKKTIHDEETITTATTTTIARNSRVVPCAKDVYGVVLLVGVGVSIVLAIWTVVDPPQKHVAGYSITTDMPQQQTQAGDEETIVHISYYCSSNQVFWNYLSIAWNIFILVCATVLVCQTNKIRQDFNEPTQLAVLVYCHSVFVMLWLISMLLSTSSADGNDGNNSVDQSSLTGFRSIVFSLDAITTLLVYFVPKFVVRQDEDDAGVDGTKSLGPIALWISNISGVSSCNTSEDDSAEKATPPPPPPPKPLEQAPRAIPANTRLETNEQGTETSLSNSKDSSSGDDDVTQLRASVDRLKWEAQTLRSDVETKDRTIALLENEVESLMEICMNHPRRGGNLDASETEGADDSENYIEESPFLVETALAPTNANKSEMDDDDDDDEEPEEPGSLQKPTLAEPIGKGNFDYGLSTIYEDVDLAQLREDEAKLLEERQVNQKAAVLASTPRELSKRKKVERAQAEVDV